MALTALEVARLTTTESVEEFMGNVATEEQLTEEMNVAFANADIAAKAAAINFCTIWPIALPALEFVRDDLLKGGGWKAILRWGLDRGINAGQKYFESQCPLPE